MPVRKTINDFLKEAKLIYGTKYDYSKVKYINTYTKVVIICPEHGEFLKTPHHFLKRKQACRECSGYTDWNWELFVKKAKEFHKGHYKYHKQPFTNIKHKYKIICPVHGEFSQAGVSHLKGGCKQCSWDTNNKNKRETKVDFIRKAIAKHGRKYDYSKVEYFNTFSNVIISCKDHGEFKMRANNHVGTEAQGCPKCGRIEAQKNIRLNWSEVKERLFKEWGNTFIYDESSYIAYTEKIRVKCQIHGWFNTTPHQLDFGRGCRKCGYISIAEKNFIPFSETLKEFTKVHGNRYQYDSKTYKGASKKIKVICSKHGEFHQSVQFHKDGGNCPKCMNEHNGDITRLDKEEFLERALLEHGDIYDYSKVNWIDMHTEIIVICSKHGDFTQIPRDHFRGSGCTVCNASRGERKIKLLLDNFKINYSMQQRFTGLEYDGPLRCDFYLTDKKIVIEYNGRQHYKAVKFFGGDKELKLTQARDKVKKEWCINNDINFEVIKYNEIIQERMDEILAKYSLKKKLKKQHNNST